MSDIHEEHSEEIVEEYGRETLMNATEELAEYLDAQLEFVGMMESGQADHPTEVTDRSIEAGQALGECLGYQAGVVYVSHLYWFGVGDWVENWRAEVNEQRDHVPDHFAGETDE